MPEPTTNPYNFVPLGTEPPKRAEYPGNLRLEAETYSGVLVCELRTLSPLFTAGKESKVDGHQSFKFLRNGLGQPMIQGTSIRGMVRSVFEAVTGSCLCLAVTKGKVKRGGSRGSTDFEFEPLGIFSTDQCSDLKRLCSACRLFGMVDATGGSDEESAHAASRVVFEDAVLQVDNQLHGPFGLQPTETPSPYHYPIYSANRAEKGPIAGRKFYYHHQPKLVSGRDWPERGKGVEEVLPVGSTLTFNVHLSGVTAEELSALLLSLELEPGLAHKLGYAKALGLGSCTISLNEEESSLEEGSSRYRSWEPVGSFSESLAELRSLRPAVVGPLRELLRFDKQRGREVGYPSWRYYRHEPAIGILDDGTFRPRSWPDDRELPPTPPWPSGITRIPIITSRPRGVEDEAEKAISLKGKKKVAVKVLEKVGKDYRVEVELTGQKLEVRFNRALELGSSVKIKVMKLDADGATIKKAVPG